MGCLLETDNYYIIKVQGHCTWKKGKQGEWANNSLSGKTKDILYKRMESTVNIVYPSSKFLDNKDTGSRNICQFTYEMTQNSKIGQEKFTVEQGENGKHMKFEIKI